MDFNSIVCFDTEFIFDKEHKLPIEVSFVSNDSDANFNCYIIPKSKNDITYRFYHYTGIDYAYLLKNGAKKSKAYKDINNYFKKQYKNKIFIGWDIVNDLKVFNMILNPFRIRKSKIKFIDLSHIYKSIKGDKTLKSLNKVCEEYNLSCDHWHDSNYDCKMVLELFKKLIEEYGEDKIMNNNYSKIRK